MLRTHGGGRWDANGHMMYDIHGHKHPAASYI